MLTLEQYLMGREKKYPEHYTPEIELAAAELLSRVNRLLDKLDLPMPAITSGWRPAPENERVGGAKHSTHLIGHGIDLRDPYRYLARVLLRNKEMLEQCGLYMEEPADAKDHVHLQDLPPASGNRIFRA